VLRLGEDPLGRSLLDDPAGAHHRNLVRDLRDDAEVVMMMNSAASTIVPWMIGSHRA
jgi:hypothetical protein